MPQTRRFIMRNLFLKFWRQGSQNWGTASGKSLCSRQSPKAEQSITKIDVSEAEPNQLFETDLLSGKPISP
jgi:hypothetical protein